MDNDQPKPFDQWCIVELMGRQVIAGHVTEQVIAGTGYLRVDVPEVASTPERRARPAYTRLINPTSVYALNPCSQAIAEAAAASWRVSDPIPLEFRPDRALGAGTDDDALDEEDGAC